MTYEEYEKRKSMNHQIIKNARTELNRLEQQMIDEHFPAKVGDKVCIKTEVYGEVYGEIEEISSVVVVPTGLRFTINVCDVEMRGYKWPVTTLTDVRIEDVTK